MARQQNKTSVKARHMKVSNKQQHHIPAEKPKATPLRRPRPPKRLVKAIRATDAHVVRLPGEALHVIEFPGVTSPGWELYRDWASSLGEVYPRINFTWTQPLGKDLVNLTYNEARSILNQLVPVRSEMLVDGEVPPLPGPFEFPDTTVNLPDARVAVTTLPDILASPGELYMTIDALPEGSYVIDIHYVRQGALLVAPIFRART